MKLFVAKRMARTAGYVNLGIGTMKVELPDSVAGLLWVYRSIEELRIDHPDADASDIMEFETAELDGKGAKR